MAGEHLLMSTMCRCAHQSQRRCRARKNTCWRTLPAARRGSPLLNLSSSLHLDGHASGGAGAGSLGLGADSVTTRAGSGGFEMRCCDLWYELMSCRSVPGQGQEHVLQCSAARGSCIPSAHRAARPVSSLEGHAHQCPNHHDYVIAIPK
jgi:hypothetical protein